MRFKSEIATPARFFPIAETRGLGPFRAADFNRFLTMRIDRGGLFFKFFGGFRLRGMGNRLAIFHWRPLLHTDLFLQQLV